MHKVKQVVYLKQSKYTVQIDEPEGVRQKVCRGQAEDRKASRIFPGSTHKSLMVTPWKSQGQRKQQVGGLTLMCVGQKCQTATGKQIQRSGMEGWCVYQELDETGRSEAGRVSNGKIVRK